MSVEKHTPALPPFDGSNDTWTGFKSGITGKLRVMKLKHVIVPRPTKKRAATKTAKADDAKTEITGESDKKAADSASFRSVPDSDDDSSILPHASFRSQQTKELYGVYQDYAVCVATDEDREQCGGVIVVYLSTALKIWAETTPLPGGADGLKLADDGHSLWKGLLHKYESGSASNKNLIVRRLLGGLQMQDESLVAFDDFVSEVKRLFQQLESLDFKIHDLISIVLESGMPDSFHGHIETAIMLGLDFDAFVTKLRDSVERSHRGGSVNFAGKRGAIENNNRSERERLKCNHCGGSGHTEDFCFDNPKSRSYRPNYKGARRTTGAGEEDKKKKKKSKNWKKTTAGKVAHLAAQLAAKQKKANSTDESSSSSSSGTSTDEDDDAAFNAMLQLVKGAGEDSN
jgi:hypothetical protein